MEEEDKRPSLDKILPKKKIDVNVLDKSNKKAKSMSFDDILGGMDNVHGEEKKNSKTSSMVLKSSHIPSSIHESETNKISYRDPDEKSNKYVIDAETRKKRW